MERVEGVGGVFFRARDPDALVAWYRDMLGVEPATDFTGQVFQDGPTVWALFPADTGYFGRPDQQLMVNYRVHDLEAMLAQLRAAGVPVDDQVHESEFGRFAWAADPEGNRFELWEPPR
jgi:catechol 2,3-dioxygenase-like lactoylglutathione lyase family enzyme